MIVILCGLPAAGKTTLATGLRRRLAARGRDVSVVHSDDYDRRTYDRVYADAAAATAGGGDGVRILDGTFYQRSHRTRFYGLDDTYEVWVRASLETCLERNRTRDDPIPERGLRAIAAEFEPPRADLEVDTEDGDAEAALDRLEEAIAEWRTE